MHFDNHIFLVAAPPVDIVGARAGGVGAVLGACSAFRAASFKVFFDSEGKSGKWLSQLPPNDPQRLSIRGVALDQASSTLWYLDYTTNFLWFLFHGPACKHLVKHPNEISVAAAERVNRAFSHEVLSVINYHQRTLLDIHDYQMIGAAPFIRAGLGLNATGQLGIAYTHHAPFPCLDHFKEVIPDRSTRIKILASFLASDSILMHVPRYSKNFVDGCVDCGFEVQVLSGGMFRVLNTLSGRRWVTVSASPIGIAGDLLHKDRAQGLRLLREELPKLFLPPFSSCVWLVRGERLDPIKNIPRAISAVDELLKCHPDLRGSFVLFQIASSSRKSKLECYKTERSEILGLVGSVNNKWRDPISGWEPIILIDGGLSQDRLVALYALADAVEATSYADGFNLSPLEFFNHRVKPGQAILSETIGFADYWKAELSHIERHQVDLLKVSAAIQLVDPFSLDDLVRARSEVIRNVLDSPNWLRKTPQLGNYLVNRHSAEDWMSIRFEVAAISVGLASTEVVPSWAEDQLSGAVGGFTRE